MNVLKIKSPDELIATVPHILGFEPEDSVVCFAFGGGPTSRLDLPTSRQEIGSWVRTLTEVYLRPNHPRQVALLAYGNDGPIGKEALTALSDALGDAEVPGPDVGPVMWVNGDHWNDLGWGTHGTVDPSTRSRIDAEFALMGRAMPARGRESLATALQGDPTAVAEHLSGAQQRVRGMDEAERRAEAGWLDARLERFRRDRTRLSEGDAARVLAIADDHGARNTAVASMNLEDSPTVSAFWQDLVRRAPTGVRDTPATLLALSCFLEGRGAQAWVALDQVSTRDRLANLVAAALQQGIDPREWERARTATTGPAMQRAALQPDHDHHPRRAAPPTAEPPGINGARPDAAPDR